jgi:formylglycine-generating enzyme required for sulfatase activity
MKNLFKLSVFFVFFSMSLNANDLSISNLVTATDKVTFNMEWKNSWNINNLSRDAVWVFIKYQDCGGSERTWDHLNLSSNSADHSVTSGSLLQIDAVNDKKGVFIRRSTFGGGDISTHTIELIFDVAFADITNINFDVIGIEMVYIPQGAFFAGDGNGVGSSLNSFASGSTAALNLPREVTSEAALAASFFRTNHAYTTHPALSASFPKGFGAVYCMKYEITQDQYVHFLNLLDAAQQGQRTALPVASAVGTSVFGGLNRNGIKIQTPATGNPMEPAVYYADGTQYLPCNFLDWPDLLAYLDWAALRPMTELEFEKICRGPSSTQLSINLEYPWGSTVIIPAYSNFLTNAGTANEKSTNIGNGLCAFNIENVFGNQPQLGPLRVGFAAGNGTSRQQAGAAFYGVLDMGGNLYEQCFTIGHSAIASIVFDGTLGDGMLDATGNANANTWNSTNSAFSIVRGGSYAHLFDFVRISDRSFLTVTNSNAFSAGRSRAKGGRGVRQF